jgi:hypothetical protein
MSSINGAPLTAGSVKSIYEKVVPPTFAIGELCFHNVRPWPGRRQFAQVNTRLRRVQCLALPQCTSVQETRKQQKQTLELTWRSNMEFTRYLHGFSGHFTIHNGFTFGMNI